MKGFLKAAKSSVKEFFADNCLNVAAAIAYFTLQSIIPLVLGIIVIGSLFFQEGIARQNFINQVSSSLPQFSNFDIGGIIDTLVKGAPGILSVSALFLIWSGSGIFDQLIFGINVAYDVKKDTRNFFFKIVLRIGLLLIIGILIAASFVVTFVFNLIFSAKAEIFGISPNNFSFLLPVFSFIIPIFLMFCVFFILYKLAPDRKGNKVKYVAIGAAVAALLFELLKNAFAFYVTSFGAADSYTKSYGAMGGILLFLLYIWLSAAIMLFGAEVAAVMGGWKSVLEGPAAQQDPGAKVEAEEVDSEGGVEVTEHEKAQGKDKPKLATKAEGKEVGGPTYVEDVNKGGATKTADEKAQDRAGRQKKAGSTHPVPAYAASTRQFPAKKDQGNPVTIVIGSIALALAALAGILFRRKGPAA